MFDSVWEDIKREFQYGNTLTRLIIFNVAIFVLVNIAALMFLLFIGKEGPGYFESTILHPWLCASYEWKHILFKPWTIFTHMFLHYDLWHVVLNMLFLYWFGRILRDLAGNDRILAIYVLGALTGFVVYVLSGVLLADMGIIGKYALGASAGVMAVVLAPAALAPEYSMHLLLVGPVRLKYIALFWVLLDLVLMSKGNTGGHLAHLGGAFMGWFFVQQLRKGNDMSIPFNRIIEQIKGFGRRIKDFFQGRRRPKVVYRNPTGTRSRGNTKPDTNTSGAPNQEYIDSILEKIKRSGYKSLTQEEREALFRASDK